MILEGDFGEQALWIPKRVPGMNDLRPNPCARKNSQHFKYHGIRGQWNKLVHIHAIAQGVKPMKRCTINMDIREPSKRRDPTNVISGAWKIILDALQVAGIIPNDDAKTITTPLPLISVDKDKVGVLIIFTPYGGSAYEVGSGSKRANTGGGEGEEPTKG